MLQATAEDMRAHSRSVHEEVVEERDYIVVRHRREQTTQSYDASLEYNAHASRTQQTSVPVLVCAMCGKVSEEPEHWRRDNPWESQNLRGAASLLRLVCELAVEEGTAATAAISEHAADASAAAAALPVDYGQAGLSEAMMGDVDDIAGAAHGSLIEDDEAFARRLQQEEHDAAQRSDGAGSMRGGGSVAATELEGAMDWEDIGALHHVGDRAPSAGETPVSRNSGVIPRRPPQVLLDDDLTAEDNSTDPPAATSRWQLAELRLWEESLRREISDIVQAQPPPDASGSPQSRASAENPTTSSLAALLEQLNEVHMTIQRRQQEEEGRTRLRMSEDEGLAFALSHAEEWGAGDEEGQDATSAVVARMLAEEEETAAQQMQADLEMAMRLAAADGPGTAE